jgi:outer membrane lipoprotein carrier protein
MRRLSARRHPIRITLTLTRLMSVPLLILSLMAAGPVGATELGCFTKRLAAAGKGTRTLRARFVQRKRLRLFRTEIITKGRIAFQRPDRLRWETLPPDASVLLVLGKRAELRIPKEKPRVIDLDRNRTMAVLVEQLLVWLGARPASDLERWYRVEVVKADRSTTLELAPKDAGLRKQLSRIEVTFGADLAIKTVRVRQRKGDTTTIEFSEIKRNAKLGKDAFK